METLSALISASHKTNADEIHSIKPTQYPFRFLSVIHPPSDCLETDSVLSYNRKKEKTHKGGKEIMMTIRRNEKIEFNPNKYLLNDMIGRNIKQPKPLGPMRQWAI
jgi:hypothetical protein